MTPKKGIPPIQEAKRAAELYIKLIKQHKVQCPPKKGDTLYAIDPYYIFGQPCFEVGEAYEILNVNDVKRTFSVRDKDGDINTIPFHRLDKYFTFTPPQESQPATTPVMGGERQHLSLTDKEILDSGYDHIVDAMQRHGHNLHQDDLEAMYIQGFKEGHNRAAQGK